MCVSHSEFWSGLPFPSPGDLSIPGIEPRSPALEGDSLLSKPPGKPPNRSLLFATPWTVAYQVPLSMGFSRQEYRNGLPFPSLGDLPNPGIKPRSSALQVDYLPSEPHRKPKNAGLGSLSLLQQIFLTQELNWGLLHCKWILYQPSYQGSPNSV